MSVRTALFGPPQFEFKELRCVERDVCGNCVYLRGFECPRVGRLHSNLTGCQYRGKIVNLALPYCFLSWLPGRRTNWHHVCHISAISSNATNNSGNLREFVAW